MSVEALTVVLHHSKAKASAKVVLLGIANHYHPDDERGAWPSQETLARYANISDRAVRKCIDELEKLGEIRVDTHGGVSSSRNKPNRYWITLTCPDDCDRSMAHRRTELLVTTGTIEHDDRNFLTSRPEPEFRRTLSETEEEPILTIKKSRQVPHDWVPTPSVADDLKKKFPSLSILLEVEAFRDHHRAKGTTFKDFDLAFRNWCRNAIKFQTPAQRKAEAPTPGPGRREWARAEHERGDHWACRPGEFGCK